MYSWNKKRTSVLYVFFLNHQHISFGKLWRASEIPEAPVERVLSIARVYNAGPVSCRRCHFRWLKALRFVREIKSCKPGLALQRQPVSEELRVAGAERREVDHVKVRQRLCLVESSD